MTTHGGLRHRGFDHADKPLPDWVTQAVEDRLERWRKEPPEIENLMPRGENVSHPQQAN